MTFRLMESKRGPTSNPDDIKMTSSEKQTYFSLGANIASQCNIAKGDKVELHWGEDADRGKIQIVKGERGSKATDSGARIRIAVPAFSESLADFKQKVVPHTIQGNAAIVSIPL